MLNCSPSPAATAAVDEDDDEVEAGVAGVAGEVAEPGEVPPLIAAKVTDDTLVWAVV